MRSYYNIPILCALLLMMIGCSSRFEHNKSLASEYIGEENRTIKTLSESDIKELQTGQGWGLAKAAELNGVPGPRHLLDMQSEINLTKEQIERIETVFNRMKNEAIPLGNRLIELEGELNGAFAGDDITEARLKELLKEIAATQSNLRFVHLNAHLQSLPILSQHQIAQYNTLRGYKATDPCSEVPEGHDPEMWRKHNNCG